VPARQYDAGELGLATTDDFTNADVLYEESLPAIRAKLHAAHAASPREVPIVTGFLGRGITTGAVALLVMTSTVNGLSMHLPCFEHRVLSVMSRHARW
jgi:aspartate kinase